MKQLKQLQRKAQKNSEASMGFASMNYVIGTMLHKLSYEASLEAVQKYMY